MQSKNGCNKANAFSLFGWCHFNIILSIINLHCCQFVPLNLDEDLQFMIYFSIFYDMNEYDVGRAVSNNRFISSATIFAWNFFISSTKLWFQWFKGEELWGWYLILIHFQASCEIWPFFLHVTSRRHDNPLLSTSYLSMVFS